MKLTVSPLTEIAQTIHNLHLNVLELSKCEAAAPVNVHSHGLLIETTLRELDRATMNLLRFQREVQGR